MYSELKCGFVPMKEYNRPTVETYGSVEELTESGMDDGYDQPR